MNHVNTYGLIRGLQFSTIAGSVKVKAVPKLLQLHPNLCWKMHQCKLSSEVIIDHYALGSFDVVAHAIRFRRD
jgi:hypothetical protein